MNTIESLSQMMQEQAELISRQIAMIDSYAQIGAEQKATIERQARTIAEMQSRMGVLMSEKAAAEARAWELSQAKAEDTELLNWLDSQVEAYGTEGYHEGNRWVIDGPFHDLRHAPQECKAYHDQCQAAQSAEKESGHD